MSCHLGDLKSKTLLHNDGGIVAREFAFPFYFYFGGWADCLTPSGQGTHS
jgi:hypothetical protein